MPRTQDINLEIRARLAAWLRYFKHTWDVTNEELAAKLELAEPTVTNAMNGTRNAGFDVFIKMVENGNVRPDELFYRDPPQIAEPPGSRNPSQVDRGGHGGRRGAGGR